MTLSPYRFIEQIAEPPSRAFCPVPGVEPNWRTKAVPGTRWEPHPNAGPRAGQNLIELRGWIRAMDPDHPGSKDCDWGYHLELDLEWLAELGCKLEQILQLGNITSQSFYARNWVPRDPGDYAQIVALPCVHVENVPWGEWRGDIAPQWVPYSGTQCGQNGTSDILYPFDPVQPLPPLGPLSPSTETYVRMFGCLITDAQHDEHNPWNDVDPDGARWTELHPVEVIERLPDKPRYDQYFGVAIFSRWGQAELDVTVEWPDVWHPGIEPEVIETVLHPLDPSTVLDGSPDGTRPRAEKTDEGLRLQLVTDSKPGGPRVKFAAFYQLRCRPQESGRLTISPAVQTLRAGQTTQLSVIPGAPVGWQTRSSSGQLDRSTGTFAAPGFVPGDLYVTVGATTTEESPPRHALGVVRLERSGARVGLYNADDLLKVFVNDREIGRAGSSAETTRFELGDVAPDDRIRFECWNHEGPFNWGWYLETVDGVVLDDSAGENAPIDKGPGAERRVVRRLEVNGRGEVLDDFLEPAPGAYLRLTPIGGYSRVLVSGQVFGVSEIDEPKVFNLGTLAPDVEITVEYWSAAVQYDWHVELYNDGEKHLDKQYIGEPAEQGDEPGLIFTETFTPTGWIDPGQTTPI